MRSLPDVKILYKNYLKVSAEITIKIIFDYNYIFFKN